MQKAYSRINWKNEPSLDTPIGANNLNKMDSALDVIDNRVLSLSGYEGRVQASEKNAKASEVNAKTSENNAKESEELAREYAERAFNTTPEGYEQIVDTVQKMDIKESADTTLLDSKAGGYKLLSMSGKSVQNGTPTPDAPQSINNVGDCVEMMQGTLSSSNGEWVTSTTRICSKNPIPCKSGDVVRIETESSKGLLLVAYYNEGGFVSVSNLANVSVANFTVPTNVTKFKIVIGDNNGITPSTVGKISLTINGKYVVQIVENGKNFLDTRGWESLLHQGVTYTPVYDSNGGLLYVNANGIATATSMLQIKDLSLKKGTYILSGCPSGGGSSAHSLYLADSSGKSLGDDFGNGVTFTLAEDTTGLILRFRMQSGYNASNLKFYPLIRKADITDGTYEPYKEKVATVLLNAPLRDTDVMSRTEVVRKRASVVFDGSETWYMGNGYFYIKVENGVETRNVLSTHYKNDNSLSTTNHGNIWINTASQLIVVDTRFTSVDNFKAWLVENNVTVEYELETPIVETLDSTSQIALNSLETFDGVTYINVDSRTQPKGINGEYGTSKVGARTIKNELKNDTLEIKYNELAVALVATESGV